MVKILLVGTGGFFGSIFRYVLTGLIHRILSTNVFFPYGTLCVNVFGCFLIGVFGGLVENRQLFGPEFRWLALIGLLGGFTTFSTFGFETFSLARDGQLVGMFANIFLHLILGLGAVWLGYVVSRLI